ncbi:MAG TPA: hypothetical protein VK154_05760 [Chitinophagales bacterium]|nr:hypothetical protein [Chitinophagales bacterium]
MKVLLILTLLLPLSLVAQVNSPAPATGVAKIYTQAIADFIKAANARNKTNFDTLFLGKRANGQPDDFPDIQLPATIEGTKIILIAPDAGAKLQRERKQRTYINLIGWVEDTKAEFIFVVFSNGFSHQYDYHIHYTYSAKQKRFELSDMQFKGPFD